MQSYLRVKIKSLADEAVHIRKEERRAKRTAAWLSDHQQDPDQARAEFNGLREHRVKVVRTEARSAQLAYAFVRGKRYSEVEKAGSSRPDRRRVAQLATRYGADPVAEDGIAAWTK